MRVRSGMEGREGKVDVRMGTGMGMGMGGVCLGRFYHHVR